VVRLLRLAGLHVDADQDAHVLRLEPPVVAVDLVLEPEPLGEHPRQPVLRFVDDEAVLLRRVPRMALEVAADHLAVGVGALERVAGRMEADECLARPDPVEKSVEVRDRQFPGRAREDHAVEGGEGLGGEGLGEPGLQLLVGFLPLLDRAAENVEVKPGLSAAQRLDLRLGDGDGGMAEAPRHRHQEQPFQRRGRLRGLHGRCETARRGPEQQAGNERDGPRHGHRVTPENVDERTGTHARGVRSDADGWSTPACGPLPGRSSPRPRHPACNPGNVADGGDACRATVHPPPTAGPPAGTGPV